jgi:tRNA threonylcarbamoyladenosine biosynthesis protein TsaE
MTRDGPFVFGSGSPEETRELGRRVGAAAGPGTLLALVGELGAGKTQFVKGLAAGAGVPDERAVTSPTFVLLNLYAGRVRVAHFDLYRLETVDLPSLGFYDVRDDSIVVVEWAEKVDERLLGDHVRVSFEVTGETARRLRFEARGPRGGAFLAGLNLSP